MRYICCCGWFFFFVAIVKFVDLFFLNISYYLFIDILCTLFTLLQMNVYITYLDHFNHDRLSPVILIYEINFKYK